MTDNYWCARVIVVDHFGVNDQVEFSGGKHGEEVITLKNTQTVALCWRNESLSFYDDEKEIDMEVHPSARYATLITLHVECVLFIEFPPLPLCRPVERDEGDQSVSLYDCLELFTQAEQLGPEGAFLRAGAKLVATHSRSDTSLRPPKRPLVLQQVRGIQAGHEEVRRVEGAAHPRGAPQAILLQEQVLAREA